MSDISVRLMPASESSNLNDNLVALFSVSAPGKVILFGDHAVVYGHPAIAVAIDLRCYFDCKLIQEPTHEPCCVVVTLKNADDFSFALNVPDSAAANCVNADCDELRHRAALLCDTVLQQSEPKPTQELLVQQSVSVCVYLLLRSLQLASSTTTDSCPLLRSGLVVYVVIHSEIPIGAGLGSSAAFSVAAATLFQILVGLFPSKGDLFVPDEKQCNHIRKLAHEAEVIVHGTPSGVDTSVITHGGAIYFQRNKNDDTPWVRLFPSYATPRLRLIVVDSKVSRSTKAIVRMVAEKYINQPILLNELFESIGKLTKQADQLLVSPDSGEAVPILAELIERNQQLLVALGVSSDTLDRIVRQLAAIGISAKLTGAGFGGCVVGLCRTVDGDCTVEQEILERAVESMTRSGFSARSVCAFANGVTFTRVRC